ETVCSCRSATAANDHAAVLAGYCAEVDYERVRLFSRLYDWKRLFFVQKQGNRVSIMRNLNDLETISAIDNLNRLRALSKFRRSRFGIKYPQSKRLVWY